MSKRRQPHTLHELTAYQLGRPLKAADVLRMEDDRPLTADELRALRSLRKARAAQARVKPQRLHHGIRTGTTEPVRMGFEEKTVGYYRYAVKRFERWARRAARLGLDKSSPPGHIREKALDVAGMVQQEGA